MKQMTKRLRRKAAEAETEKKQQGMREEQEEPRERVNHDEAFKKLLHTFAKEFIELFFPELAERIDFTQVTFLPEEQVNDIIGKHSRRLDVLLQAKLQGQEVHVLIHAEPQSWHDEEFHERMYIYFGRLYERYRKENKPIIPIAVFTGSRKKEERDEIVMEIAGHEILRFRFLKVQLIRRHWRQFIDSDNPVAAALLAKMVYNKKERRELRAQYLRMLLRLRMNLDDARLALVMSIADLYYKPNVKEDESIMEELSEQNPKEGAELMKLMPEWSKQAYKEGLEEGIERGVEQGMEKGKEQVILKLLSKDFSLEQVAELIDEPVDRIKKLVE